MFLSMKDVLAGFTKRMQFATVSKTATDYESAETKASVTWFSANVQPISPQRLQMKPEGQRQWKFLDMWTVQLLNLDDIIKDKCQKEYRVLSKSDWSDAGYYQYELTEKAQ
jgi:hypothetical protein